ncbi:PTS sugar transporter subunit IIA [Enterococcus faecium]|uniref:PTS sugar transporter subunit IIA n=1 Tax=Enterococcus faecium TaxID=1352 RepID=UPI0023B2CF9A|nr:PTS mannose transporter subunit IIA [Enterococcus faecium]
MKKAYFLISHNQFAEGLKNALEMIIGKQDNLRAYGLMPGGHPDEIIAKIEEQITDEMEVVILGDIAGGSVCNSALELTTHPNVVLVTGTNLSLAMEIVGSQTTKKAEIDVIIANAREGMKILTVDLNAQSGGNDFF